VIVSVLVGTVVGFSLPLVLARIIDLRSFVGGRVQPDPAVDPAAVILALAAVAVVAIAAGAVAQVIAKRLAPATTLKMGER
jgi:hypothetical protein